MKPLLAATAFCLLSCAGGAHAVDDRYPAYVAKPGLAGEIAASSVPASPKLMLLWQEGFRARHPNVTIVAGRAGDGIETRAAVEALAVLVHKDNPVACVSIALLREIYAAPATWGAAGLDGAWAAMPVVAFGMTGSEQDFFSGRTGVAPAPHVTAQARASALLRVLAETPGGIGYAPAGYRGESVRAVPVSDGGECVAPTEANAHRAAYPLARVVSLHARGAAARDFAGYVLSQEGQRDAVIAGHFSLPYVFAAEARTALGLD